MDSIAGAPESLWLTETQGRGQPVAADGTARAAEAQSASRWSWLDWAAPLLIMMLHLALALYVKSLGVSAFADPDRHTWDYYWQSLPADTLLHNLGQGILYLHMQPPLYNLWGALHLRLFGEPVLGAIHWSQIGLGVLTCGMFYPIGKAMGLPRAAALVVGALLAALPSILLYEAYGLYEMLTLFLLTATVFAAALFQRRQAAWALLFTVVALNLLMLTRSSYHLLLIVPVAAILLIGARAQRMRLLIFVVLLTLPTIGWYAKNQAIFGFFGASSWMGMSIFRAAVRNLPQEALERYVAEGVVARETVDQPKGFRRPEIYAPYGYRKQSPIAVLNADDLNNINIIDVARTYQSSALRLLQREPRNYLNNVGISYTRFNWPTTGYGQISFNEKKLPAWLMAYERALYLLPWLERYGSVTFWLIPLIQVQLLAWWLLRRWRRQESLAQFIRAAPAVLVADVLLVYTVIVANMLEYGENDRFRFAVEPLIWLLFAGLTASMITEIARRGGTRVSLPAGANLTGEVGA